MDLHTPYSTVSFGMTLSDLEWLSKIFNDRKRRAVSLQQLTFLFTIIFTVWLHFCSWYPETALYPRTAFTDHWTAQCRGK